MDNFFASVYLFQELLSENIYCCGTVRPNRKGFPAMLKGVNLKEQGDSKFARSGNMVCTVWRDKASKKLVTVLSTQCNPVGGDQVKRKKKQRGSWVEIMINRPPSVSLYNKFMGGVDMQDQARRYYNVTLKSVKWWKYLFWFFLDTAIINSYILYSESNEKHITHLDFRLKLSRELTGNHCSRKRAGRPRSNPVFADVLDHVYDRIVEKNQKAKPCEACKARNQRLRCTNKKSDRPKESQDGCCGCNVILCKGLCFKEWHSNFRSQDNNNDIDTSD